MAKADRLLGEIPAANDVKSRLPCQESNDAVVDIISTFHSAAEVSMDSIATITTV